MNLPEIAADVAQALGSGEFRPAENIHDAFWLIGPRGERELLRADGSNLTDAWVFKACCEWLNTRKFVVTLGTETHMCDDYMKNRSVWADCHIALAPAALVSAVWRSNRRSRMAEIDHDAAIAAVRYHADAIEEAPELCLPDLPAQLRYVADLAERAKRLEEALQKIERWIGEFPAERRNLGRRIANVLWRSLRLKWRARLYAIRGPHRPRMEGQAVTTDEIKNSGNFTITGVKIEHSDAGFYYMHNNTDKIRALADEFEKEWGPSPLGELEARVVSALRQWAEERDNHEKSLRLLREERDREERLQPLQPIYLDKNGAPRFKENKIVRFLLDNGPFDLNDLATKGFSQGDEEQFAQLIGYSLGGFGELSYVSDETYERAEKRAAQLAEATPAPAESTPGPSPGSPAGTPGS